MGLSELIKILLRIKPAEKPSVEDAAIDTKVLDTSKILASVDPTVVEQIFYAKELPEDEKGLVYVCQMHYGCDYARMIQEMKRMYSASASQGGGEWLVAIQSAEKLMKYEADNKVSLWKNLVQYDKDFRKKYIPPPKHQGPSGFRAAAIL